MLILHFDYTLFRIRSRDIIIALEYLQQKITRKDNETVLTLRFICSYIISYIISNYVLLSHKLYKYVLSKCVFLSLKLYKYVLSVCYYIHISQKIMIMTF